MAALNPLDEKLAEVLGLAQAAGEAIDQVGKLEHAGPFRERLARMGEQTADVARRTDALIDGFEGKKTSIRDMARETKAEAVAMMQTYLGGEQQALDGFEFLAMAEAGELCHWEIVQVMSAELGIASIRELAVWAVAIQRNHVDTVRDATLELAIDEVGEAAAA